MGTSTNADAIRSRLAVTPTGRLLMMMSIAEATHALEEMRPSVAGALHPALRVAIRLAVAEEHECARCLADASAAGRGLGLSEHELLDARLGVSDDPTVQRALDLVHHLLDTGGYISDIDLRELRAAGFGDAQVVELVAASTESLFHDRFLHAAPIAVLPRSADENARRRGA